MTAMALRSGIIRTMTPDRWEGPALVAAFALAAAACGDPSPTSLDPATPRDPARFAYVQVDQTRGLAAFRIDAETQDLVPLPDGDSLVAPYTSRLLVHPSGRFLFATPASRSIGSPTIDGFAIDTVTGWLTPIPGLPIRTSSLHGAQLTPDGRFMYVGNPRANYEEEAPAVRGFEVDGGSGALRALALDAPAGRYAGDVIIHPSGRTLYVTHFPNASDLDRPVTVTMRIDQATGALDVARQIEGRVYGRIEPRGRFIYGTNWTSLGTALRMVPVAADASLTTAVARDVVAPADDVLDFDFDPAGELVYIIAGERQLGSLPPRRLASFDIQADGTLVRRSNWFGAPGEGCFHLTADPGGDFLYLASGCTQSEVLHGSTWGNPGELYMIKVDAGRRTFTISSGAPRRTGYGPHAVAAVR